MLPLVSVITPTWLRHDVLLNRCIPSVRAQSYPRLEHVIVSDGPDPVLRGRLGSAGVKFAELPSHPEGERWGGADARNRGAELAAGDLIAYLDDDDAFRPRHLEVLAAALEREPAAGFAYSRAIVTCGDRKVRIGDGPLACGRILDCMIMHRREILGVAAWRHLMPADDWDLVSRWLDAGISYVSVDAETADYYPAEPIDLTEKTYVTFPPHGRRLECAS